MREGCTGMQQTAAESALFARQTRLVFRTWLFLGRVTCRNVCAGWVFPIEHNTFEVRVAPPARYELRTNNLAI